MGLYVSSQQLQPVDYYDSALSLLDGSLMNRYKMTLNFYFSKYTGQKRLQFKSFGGVNTITNINGLDNESFLQLAADNSSLLIGETIKSQSSALNTGTLTITGVTATVITVSNTLVNETVEVDCLYVTSAVTALDYYYNLIGNQENLSFVSKTDKGFYQKYNVTGIAAETSTPKYLNIASKSNAWVTDILTGIASTSTIAGAGISGVGSAYKQAFTIVHYFSQDYFTANSINNFATLLPPSLYNASSGAISGGGLQYVYNIGAKYLSTDVTPQNAITVNNQNGISTWVDSNPAGTMPDFTVGSISYIDTVTGNTISAIDFSRTVNVTIVLKSASAAFLNNTSVIDLNHFYAPNNPMQYQNTNSTMWQNLLRDRIALTVANSPSPVNGIFYGSIYQVIVGAKATYNSTSQVTVTFQTTLSQAATAPYNSLITAVGNRNYGIVCTCEGANNLTRTSVLCDFNSYLYDQTNITLMKLWDYCHVYPYPNVLGAGVNTVAGREGDKFVAKVPFQMLTTSVNGVSPLLQNIVMSVVAKKNGKPDFTVESQTINAGASCSFNGQQTPNISISRGYNTFAGDPFNLITLKPCKDYNGASGSGYAGYLFSYPLILRYDYWNSINASIPGQANCNALGITNDVKNVNNSWSNLQTNGWSLVLRFTAVVTGYDGYNTSFTFDTAIVAANLGIPPLNGPSFVETTTYYDANPSSTTYGQVVGGLIPASQTRVSMTYTPDGTTNPYNSAKGTMWVDLVGQGGGTAAWLASTEIPKVNGSPWSPAAKNGSPVTFRSHGLSINIYSSGVIIIEGIYDDTVLSWANQNKQIISAGNMALYNSGIETAGGETIETAGGRIIE